MIVYVRTGNWAHEGGRVDLVTADPDLAMPGHLRWTEHRQRPSFEWPPAKRGEWSTSHQPENGFDWYEVEAWEVAP